MDNNEASWQYLSANDVTQAFSTDGARGLKESSVSHRLAKFRGNHLWDVGKVSLRSIAVKYLLDGAFVFLFADLLCAAFVGFDLQFSLILLLTVAFVAFRVVCDVLLARYARRGAESLVPETLVIREGKAQTVRATTLVPGDIVILGEGDLVTADMRVISATDLVVSENEVTANEIPVEKTEKALKRRPFTGEAENMSNMLFAFSYVLSGSARAVVVATGDDTLAAKKGIRRKIAPKAESTRMKKAERTAALSSSVLMIAALVYVFVGLFAFRGKFTVTGLFLSALSFAVAGFGTIWHSIVLFAHSDRTARLFRAGTTLRSPDAVQIASECPALVVPDVISLTDGKPRIHTVVTCGRVIGADKLDKNDGELREFFRMLAVAAGTSDSALYAEGASPGMTAADSAARDYLRRTGAKASALTGSVLVAGRAPKGGGNALDTVMYTENGVYNAVCAGDTDMILAVCDTVILDGFEETLTRERKARYSSMARELEEKGCRVIALAHRLPPTENFTLLSVIQHSMSFAGFVALEPVAAPMSDELVEAFSTPGRSILCFASCRSDAFFAAGKSILPGARVSTVKSVREANVIPLEKGKNNVVCVPGDILAPEEATRLRLIVVRRLKKAVGDAVCAGSSLADGAFVREAKLRICLEDTNALRPAPYSIVNSAHAICESEGGRIPCPGTVGLLCLNDEEKRLSLIGKYLIRSQIVRAALFAATLFLPPVIPAVSFILWGFVVDGGAAAFLLYSKGVSDYLKRPPKEQKKPDASESGPKDAPEKDENSGK